MPQASARSAVSDLEPVEELLPQRLVVTILGTYLRDRAQPVWAGGMVQLLEGFGFSRGAARIALTRLITRRLMDRERRGRLMFYRPTDRSIALLREGDRRIFELGTPAKPGEAWTVVWYSLPDHARVERHRLSRRLRFLGFGSLEDGAWICPRDESDEVRKIFRELGVNRRGVVLRAHPAEFADMRPIVDRAWDLDDLAGRYRRFGATFAPYRRPAEQLTDEQAFRVRTLMIDAYRQYPFLDPDLPTALLPRRWSQPRARDIFHTLFSELAESSQRHFDAMTRVVDS